jgi:hypothetical protein
LAPRSVILSFYSVVNGGPREVPELEVRERPPSTLRNIDGGPPCGARVGGPGVPTINAKER